MVQSHTSPLYQPINKCAVTTTQGQMFSVFRLNSVRLCLFRIRAYKMGVSVS